MAGTPMITHINNIPVSNPNQYKGLRYKPAILYYLRLQFPSTIINNNGQNGNGIAGTGANVLYKLGYTTTSIQERIFGKLPSYYWRNGKRVRAAGHKGMGLPTGTDVYVIAAYQHSNGSLVYQWEQYLHNKYKEQGYKGNPVMANGNTELYTRDILGLDS